MLGSGGRRKLLTMQASAKSRWCSPTLIMHRTINVSNGSNYQCYELLTLLTTEKIVVGSFSGLLRIFNVNGSDSLSGYQISDLLLELELKHPIIQLLVGLFLAASDKLHLAVLHPRKLSVYSVAGNLYKTICTMQNKFY